MRNVQRLLAREGVRFDRYYTTTSECCSVARSILTGHIRTTRACRELRAHGYPRFDDRSTLATWLHDAGYTTAMVGKYLNGYTLAGDRRVRPGGTGGWRWTASPRSATTGTR